MKKWKRLLSTAAATALVAGCSGRPSGAGRTAAAPLPPPASAPAAVSTEGLLSDAEIAALQTEWTDTKTGARASFQADFLVPAVSSEELDAFQKSGKVPFRITVQFQEIREENGGRITNPLTQTVTFYLLDADGRLLLKESASSCALCPS
jgi:hypothetical protein